MSGEHNNLGSTTQQEGAATQGRTNSANNWNNLAGMGYSDLASLGLGPVPQVGTQTQITSNGVPENISPLNPSGVADTGGSGYGLISNLGLAQYNQSQQGGNTAIAAYENAAGLPNTTGSTVTQPSPYQLTPAQQQELNTQTDVLNQRGQSAAQNLTAAYAARGISDPAAIAAGQAMLKQNTSGLVNGYQAQFAQNAQTNAQTAAEQLAQYYNTTGQQGMSALEGGIQGANQLIEGAAGGQLSTSQANQEAAQASQQQANNVSNQVGSTLGSIFGIAANAATGGYSKLFGGGKTRSTATSTNSGLTPLQAETQNAAYDTAYGTPIPGDLGTNAFGAPLTSGDLGTNAFGAPLTSGNVFTSAYGGVPPSGGY